MAGNPRNANGYRRRQLRRRIIAVENVCAICHEPVDKTLSLMAGQHSPRCFTPDCTGCVPDPRRAEIDEKVPVSLGGDPLLRSNTQLAHRECNRRKSARVLLPLTEVVTSREW